MAQRLVTSFISTSVPGAYPNTTVQSNPVALGSSGNIVIIGEAEGGPSYQTVILKNNVFGPTQFAQVQRTYISGPIVQAMAALSSPSADPGIQGAPTSITILKTNTGTQASAILDTNYGTLTDRNYGRPGNLYKYNVTQTALESAPAVSGGTIPSLGAALNGASFSLRLNGGAVSVVTLSITTTNHSTVASLVTELNSLLPAGVVASAGSAPSSIQLTVAPDSAANRKGWGKALELIDSTVGNLAALGLSAGLTVSSQEPSVEVDIIRPDIGLNEAFVITSPIALSLGYAGSSASVTINQTAKTLVTSVTGGSGANLSVDLTQFKTLSDLVTFISAQPGYSASVAPSVQQLSPAVLDSVSAIGIASTASVQPGRVKSASFSFQAALAKSRGVSFTPQATAGLPNPMASASFLSGGLRGATLGADIVNAVAQMGGINTNIIVPLFSQDASADIALGLTDSGSTYTIAAVHTAIKNHCIQYSTPLLKKNRIAILSQNGLYAAAKIEAQNLSQYRVSMTMQQVSAQDPVTGSIQTYQPWYAACIAAGMQAAGFYRSITNKQANVISLIDPSDFDSGNPGYVEDALNSGLLILSNVANAPTWVSDQTTYSRDANFVYNTIQAVYTSDLIALDLAASFQNAFVGKSLADVDASVGLAFLAQKMTGYKALKLIASSDDAPAGFKNPKVTISAPNMEVSVDIKLATAIYFIPISVNLSQVVQK